LEQSYRAAGVNALLKEGAHTDSRIPSDGRDRQGIASPLRPKLLSTCDLGSTQ